MTPGPKPIRFSKHALDQVGNRGASRAEVEETIRAGRQISARQGRRGFRREFPYNATWGGKPYATKRIEAIVAEAAEAIVVVTVYSFYY